MNIVVKAHYSSEEGFSLFPLSCIHWPLTNRRMLRRWVETIRSRKHAYVLLLGDQFEGTRTSFRQHMKGYSKDTNSKSVFDALIVKQVSELARELEPIRDRIIGVLQGNHFYDFFGDRTSDQELCSQLDIPFLGVETAIRLECIDKSNKRRATLVLAAHHHGGGSGGTTFGSDINKLHKFEQVWDADIYCLGHTHKTLSFRTARHAISRQGKLTEGDKKQLFLRCGCMRDRAPEAADSSLAYNPDYAKMEAYPPIPFSWIEAQVQINSTTGEVKYRTIVEEP